MWGRVTAHCLVEETKTLFSKCSYLFLGFLTVNKIYIPPAGPIERANTSLSASLIGNVKGYFNMYTHVHSIYVHLNIALCHVTYFLQHPTIQATLNHLKMAKAHGEFG